MKKTFRKILCCLLTAAAILVSVPASGINSAAASLSEDNQKLAQGLLGYGYNITGGKELEKLNLIKSNRILDMSNEELLSHIYVSKVGKTTSENGVAYNAKELVEQIGSEYSGGTGGGVSLGKIGAVNADIMAKYDRTSNVTNISEERYEYYIMKICNRQIGFEGLGLSDYRKYLDTGFKGELEAVKNEEDAKNLMNKYGTHLFTGYNLGGRMDITNYQSRSQAISDWASDVSLSEQIGVAIKCVNTGESFSITEKYKSHSDSSQLTSNYKCQTLGGKAVGSLTIDSLFTYSESMLDGKGHYIYENWINSINDDSGELLDIIGIPTDGAAIPIWDLLPTDAGYNKIRLLLLQAYTELCGDKYAEYMKNLPKLSDSIGIGTESEHGSIVITGCYLENNGIFTVHENDGTQSITVNPGSVIRMTYDDYTSLNHFDKVDWTVSSSAPITVNDSIGGVFTVSPSAKNGQKFTVTVSVCGIEQDIRTFTVRKREFSGGTGSQDDPYIISTVEDWKSLTNAAYWDKSFILANDLDLSAISGASGLNNYASIGLESTPFSGTFDGNYCTISGYSITSDNASDVAQIGLFGYNKGIIKNLKVNEPKIEVMMNRDVSTLPLSRTIIAGGLIGTNAGTIRNCVVISPSISYTYNEETEQNVKGDTYNFLLGGLVGQNQEGIVEKCGVINPYICCDFHTDKTAYRRINIYTYLGGFTGKDDKGTYSDCYETVNKLNGPALISHICGKKRLLASETFGYQYVGGMVGYIVSAVKLDTCVINFPYASIQKDNCDSSTKNEQYFGSLFGYNQNNELKSLSNVYVVDVKRRAVSDKDAPELTISATRQNGAGNLEYSNKSGELQRLDTDSVLFSNTVLSSVINEKNGWCADKANNSPTLQSFAFGFSAMEVEGQFVDFELRRSYVPDKAGAFHVVLTDGYGSGEQIPLSCFHIDYSAFSSAGARNCMIRVYTSDELSKSYQVKVNRRTVVAVAANDTTKAPLYAGTKYNIIGRTIDLTTAYSNGEVLKSSPLSYSLVSDEPILREGHNLITLKTDGLECTFVVTAVEREIVALTMEQGPSKTEYYVGSTFSTDGMKVTAQYTDNTSAVVDNADLEIIGDRIVEGQNDIIVSYGPYVTLSSPVSVTGIKEEIPTEPPTEAPTEPPTEVLTESATEPDTEQVTEAITESSATETETTVDPVDSIVSVADTNGDGEVTFADAVLLLRYIHFPAHNPIKAGAGDVDGDGHVTSDDAVYLNNYLFSPRSYPIGK